MAPNSDQHGGRHSDWRSNVCGYRITSRHAAGREPTVRWDCINSTPGILHISLLILLSLVRTVQWSLQTLYVTVLPALAVATSVAFIALVMGEETKVPGAEMNRWVYRC